MSAWTFHFRWIAWALGVVSVSLIGIQHHFRNKWIAKHLKKLSFKADQNFHIILFALCLSYFGFAAFSKYLQLENLGLHGQDFWLFTDILEQMKEGGLFLTRFAPQGIGYVQHGAVHPMWTWGLLLPLAWLFGSVHVSLLFNPAVLAAAGGMIGILSRNRWGAPQALLLSMAFLFSTQVGKILNYEVHPEAAYPFLGFLWIWTLRNCAHPSVQRALLCFTTLALIGVKEDSFLIFFPTLIWMIYSSYRKRDPISDSNLFLTGALGTVGVILQLYLVKQWSTGTLGPLSWKGNPVSFHFSAGGFKGFHWSGWTEISALLKALIQDHGGFWEVLRRWGGFLISRPWLSLIVLAPWVLKQLRFWWLVLPLAFAYSLLNGPNLLWNYYSAPFLFLFWLCVIDSPESGRPKKSYALWIFLASALLGSGGIQWGWPSQKARMIRQQAEKRISCLGEQGLVPSYLIPWVPLEKVWTDRVPLEDRDWKTLDFILFSPAFSSFELPQNQAQSLYEQLKADPNWEEWDEHCRPKSSSPQNQGARSNPESIVLFCRNRIGS